MSTPVAVTVGDTVEHTNSKRRGIVQAVRPQRDGTFEYDVLIDIEEITWNSARVVLVPEPRTSALRQPTDLER